MDHFDAQFVPSKPSSIDLNKAKALPVPQVDDWTLQLAVICQGIRTGGALALDGKLTRAIPTTLEDCIAFLEKSTGATFSVLSKLQHDRFRRALTAVLSKNVVSDGIHLRTKVSAGIQYSKLLENKQLQSELETILADLDATASSATSNTDDTCALILRAAELISYNPSRMVSKVVDGTEESPLTAENLVELVSFFDTIQALHTIEVYFQVAEARRINPSAQKNDSQQQTMDHANSAQVVSDSKQSL